MQNNIKTELIVNYYGQKLTLRATHGFENKISNIKNFLAKPCSESDTHVLTP